MTQQITPIEPDLIARDELAAATETVPLLREQARGSEEARKMSRPVEDALRAGGLFRLAQPKRYGGSQASMRTILDVTTEIGRGDPSASWVVMILTDSAFLTALFPEQAQDDVWKDNPDAAISAVLAPTAKAEETADGYRITGEWRSNSGTYQSQWVLCSFPIPPKEGEEPDLGLGLVPHSELEVIETWEVAGMAGTGSHSVVAKDVEIPRHRVIRFSSLITGGTAPAYADEIEYRGSPLTAFCVPILGPILGAAQAALEFTLKALESPKPIAYSAYGKSIDSPSYRLSVADAANLIDSAVLHAQRAADDTDRFATSGAYPSDIERARVRMDLATATTRAKQAVDLLLNVQGAGAFGLANPLQRVWRDLNAAARHPHLNVDLSREIYAHALLDYQPQVAPF